MNSMQEILRLKISLESESGQHIFQDVFDLDRISNTNEFTLPVSLVLAKINEFLKMTYLVVSEYLHIWVVTKNGRQNLFKLKKKGLDLRLMANEEDGFELNILLVDVSQKNNTLKNFNQTIEQYNRLNANINKIIDESRKEAQTRGERELRPIDIAYLFADPLVEVKNINSQPRAKFEVSYQIEYDKFIEMVREEDLGSNLRIEMMVATQTNIKNTLIDGVSILHFACHGKATTSSQGERQTNLQIERERPVGELMDLQEKRFTKLLQNKTLPKVIIFNVCFSSFLAKKISQKKNIITIGYNSEASDEYCEEFTREFYKGLFKDRIPARPLFERIKQRIIEKNKVEGEKLQIFPENPIVGEDNPIIEVAEQNVNWLQKWTPSLSLRQSDAMGVKKEMYKFIKDFLTQNERMEYLFMVGAPSSGKTLFMKKTQIYVMNRKVFTDDLVIDLKDESGVVEMDSLLRFRLEREGLIDTTMGELKEHGKDRRIRPLIIMDHFQKIIRYEYHKLISYVDQKFIKKFKQGKVVIISNQIEPIIEEEARSFAKAIRHRKETPELQEKQLQNLVNRYTKMKWDKTLKNPYNSLKFQKGYSPIQLVEALKHCERPELLVQKYQQLRAAAQCEAIPTEQRAIEQLTLQTHTLQKSIDRQIDSVSVRIEQNDYIFLSTIFDEIALRKLRSQNNPELVRMHSEDGSNRSEGNRFHALIVAFKLFFQGLIKDYNKKVIKQMLKYITHLSLKLAAICYFHGELGLFEDHLLNCEKFYTMISAVFWDELRLRQIDNRGELVNLCSLLRDYRLRILLTLYSYYSQTKFRLQAKEFRSPEEEEAMGKWVKKGEVVVEQLNKQFEKKQLNHYYNLLQNLFPINNIAQELHAKTEYRFLIHDNRRVRRESDYFDPSNEEINFEQNAKRIDLHHRKVQEYYKHYQQLDNLFNHCEVLSRDSLLLILLLVLKLVFFNLSELEQLQVKGEEFLKLGRMDYVGLYIKIMQKIREKGVFSTKHTDSIFTYQENDCIRSLYKTYLKNYISIYFQLEKTRQSITKDYSLKIYYDLINLCDSTSIAALSSLRKMIEMHISQQFFNTWSVKTYVSLPLFVTENNGRVKSNLKRYEEHIFKFQHCLFKHELDKEINFKIALLSRKNLEQEASLQENSSKNIIYLLVGDCKINSNKLDGDKICLESEVGYLQTQKLRNIVLPKAPIVMVFGANATRLKAWYEQQRCDCIIILMDMKYTDFDREMKIGELEKYAIRLQIYYTVLQFFYCSFCRHFFNADHKLFVEQVRSSFYLAKAEAMIKTKIRFCSGTQFNHRDVIESIITNIEFNLQNVLDSSYGAELQTRSAYHFIYKQRKPKHHDNRCRFDDIKYSIRAEIGGNQQIHDVLKKMAEKDGESLNITVEYKSEEMLNFFLRSLKIKLQKLQRYSVDKTTVDAQGFNNYRKILRSEQRYIGEEHYEDSEPQLVEVRFFHNLTGDQTSLQLGLAAACQFPKTIRVFCFSNLPQIAMQMDLGVFIQQTNEHNGNRCEFQLYFLERLNEKNFRSTINDRKFQAIYKRVFQRNQRNRQQPDLRSLLDIRHEVEAQKLRNR